MSWHDRCIAFKGTKPNRYVFFNDDATMNRVKWGGNFDNKHWIVSDYKLTEEQLNIVLTNMGMRPGLDTLVNRKDYWRFKKSIYWMEIGW